MEELRRQRSRALPYEGGGGAGAGRSSPGQRETPPSGRGHQGIRSLRRPPEPAPHTRSNPALLETRVGAADGPLEGPATRRAADASTAEGSRPAARRELSNCGLGRDRERQHRRPQRTRRTLHGRARPGQNTWDGESTSMGARNQQRASPEHRTAAAATAEGEGTPPGEADAPGPRRAGGRPSQRPPLHGIRSSGADAAGEAAPPNPARGDTEPGPTQGATRRAPGVNRAGGRGAHPVGHA